MPYYTRCYEKKPFFIRGRKPEELAEISKISQRQWQRYQTDQHRQNPILTGMRYLKVFEQESVTSYAKAAEILGVSRVRVYQLASLVMKLPKEIVDFLAGNEDPAILRHFTERKLRPLTKLPEKKQITECREMLKEATAP